jgi:hypothetical protein
MKDLDAITRYGKQALDVLMVFDPRATSLGIFAGVLFHGIVGLFAPVLSTIQVINIAALRFWHYLAVGVFMFNIPKFIRRNKIDPKITEALNYIKDQKQSGHIEEWQAKQMYVNLHQKVLENIVLEAKANEALSKMVGLAEGEESEGEDK